MAPVGADHCLSGKPDFTHTNTFRNVPLSLTTTSCDFWGVVCARAHAGVASMLMFFMAGFSPVKATFPLMFPALASSIAGGGVPAAVFVASSLGLTLSDVSDLPH